MYHVPRTKYNVQSRKYEVRDTVFLLMLNIELLLMKEEVGKASLPTEGRSLLSADFLVLALVSWFSALAYLPQAGF